MSLPNYSLSFFTEVTGTLNSCVSIMIYDGSSLSPVPFTAELVLVLGCLPDLESKCIGDAIRNGKLVKTKKPFPEQGDRGFRQSTFCLPPTHGKLVSKRESRTPYP